MRWSCRAHHPHFVPKWSRWERLFPNTSFPGSTTCPNSFFPFAGHFISSPECVIGGGDSQSRRDLPPALTPLPSLAVKVEEPVSMEMDNHMSEKDDGCYDNAEAAFSDDEEDLSSKGERAQAAKHLRSQLGHRRGQIAAVCLRAGQCFPTGFVGTFLS